MNLLIMAGKCLLENGKDKIFIIPSDMTIVERESLIGHMESIISELSKITVDEVTEQFMGKKVIHIKARSISEVIEVKEKILAKKIAITIRTEDGGILPYNWDFFRKVYTLAE